MSSNARPALKTAGTIRRTPCQRHAHACVRSFWSKSHPYPTALSTTPQVTSAAVSRCAVRNSCGRIAANSAATARATASTARSNASGMSSVTTAPGVSRRDASVVRQSAVRSRARHCPRPARSGATIRDHQTALQPQLAASHAAQSASGPATVYLSECRDSAVVSEAATGTPDPDRRPVPIQAVGLPPLRFSTLFGAPRLDSAAGHPRRTRAGAASPAVKHVGVSPTCRHTRPTRS